MLITGFAVAIGSPWWLIVHQITMRLPKPKWPLAVALAISIALVFAGIAIWSASRALHRASVKVAALENLKFTVGQHNIGYLLDDMARLHSQHGVRSFSVILLRRKDHVARRVAERRSDVLHWASDNDIDIDWKPIEQHGSRYNSYFLSGWHTKHLPLGEWGTWEKSGW